MRTSTFFGTLNTSAFHHCQLQYLVAALHMNYKYGNSIDCILSKLLLKATQWVILILGTRELLQMIPTSVGLSQAFCRRNQVENQTNKRIIKSISLLLFLVGCFETVEQLASIIATES